MRFLWDLDGTIFDTYPIALESFNMIYQDLNGSSVDKEKLLPMLKRSSKEAFVYFKIPVALQKKFKQINHERLEKFSKPFRGVKEILSDAKVNVMVTHRAKQSTKQSLEKWGLLQYFDEIVSPDDDGFLRKPDIGAYQYLYDTYKIDWAVGDRALDLIPAKAVGMKTCAFQNCEIEADLHVSEYNHLFMKDLETIK